MCTKHTFAWLNVLLCFQTPLCVCSYSWPHDLVARAGGYESADNNSCTSSTTASSYDIGKSLGGVEVTVVRQLSYWFTKANTSYFCFNLQKKYSEYLHIYEYLPMLCGLYHNVLVTKQKLNACLSHCMAWSEFRKQRCSVFKVYWRSHGSCCSCPTWSKGSGVF